MAFAGHQAPAFATTCGKVKVVPTAPSMVFQRLGTTQRSTNIRRALLVVRMLQPAMATVDAPTLAFVNVTLAIMVGQWCVGIKLWPAPMDGTELQRFQIATSKCPWARQFGASAV